MRVYMPCVHMLAYIRVCTQCTHKQVYVCVQHACIHTLAYIHYTQARGLGLCSGLAQKLLRISQTIFCGIFPSYTLHARYISFYTSIYTSLSTLLFIRPFLHYYLYVSFYTTIDTSLSTLILILRLDSKPSYTRLYIPYILHSALNHHCTLSCSPSESP